ncbi:hypothetical protein D3C71_2065890 [compost metagenome]
MINADIGRDFFLDVGGVHQDAVQLFGAFVHQFFIREGGQFGGVILPCVTQEDAVIVVVFVVAIGVDIMDKAVSDEHLRDFFVVRKE